MGEPDEINIENETFLYDVFEKHKNHHRILKIKIHLLRHFMLNLHPKVVKMCFNELSMTLMELLNYGFKHKRFPDEM